MKKINLMQLLVRDNTIPIEFLMKMYTIWSPLRVKKKKKKWSLNVFLAKSK